MGGLLVDAPSVQWDVSSFDKALLKVVSVSSVYVIINV